jgi:hypothetical protein
MGDGCSVVGLDDDDDDVVVVDSIGLDATSGRIVDGCIVGLGDMVPSFSTAGDSHLKLPFPNTIQLSNNRSPTSAITILIVFHDDDPSSP